VFDVAQHFIAMAADADLFKLFGYAVRFQPFVEKHERRQKGTSSKVIVNPHPGFNIMMQHRHV
jgi:hypothetical protein